MKNVALHNLGCKVNAYEIEVIQQKLQESGYNIVPFAPGADIYIINTCTVTNIADRKSRQMLHKAKKMNPDAIVVAVGCYVQTGIQTIELDDSIDLAVGNNRKNDLVPILEEFLREKNIDSMPSKTNHDTTLIDMNRECEYEEMTRKGTADHTRAYIKIQDGCNQFCSYCIIPYARGRVRSRKKDDILNEIKGLADSGYHEVVITGIHISSYGIDFVTKGEGDYLDAKQDLRAAAFKKGYFIQLLEAIQEVEGIRRIRIGSLEPRIISEEFVTRLSRLTKVCPHFHLSLQSGCDATLKRMNRHYTADEYEQKVRLLRAYFDKPAITTDVIVGFPGETEEEFRMTKAFLERIDFYEMHVFKYSKRQGTTAATMPDQVPETTKAQRSELLLALDAEKSTAYRVQYFGKMVTVLMEEEKEFEDGIYQIGFTESYVKVGLKTEESLSNQFVTGIVSGFLTDGILLMQEKNPLNFNVR